MMIPLRRAFIVKQHGVLPYPEGTACADVLIAGEKGGATAKTVFVGFGIALVHKFLMKAMHLWKEEANQSLWTATASGSTQGLKGAVLGGELSPELLGVGYVIGPRIAAVVFAGGVLAYLVLAPAIVLFATHQSSPLAPATASGASGGLIPNMSVGEIRNNYILYIGAGAVATGGIISMLQALPMIWTSLAGGLRDLRGGRGGVAGNGSNAPRTQQDMPMSVVFLGSIALVFALAAFPSLGLGFSLYGIVGAMLIVFFGFLFVTVSSRLTGQIGSSSNPIWSPSRRCRSRRSCASPHPTAAPRRRNSKRDSSSAGRRAISNGRS
jgi:putative OPT family oligopeptide transporter